MQPFDSSTSNLDAIFSALSDPTRRAIVLRLMDGEAGVVEIATRFPLTQPAISKHLKVLETAGLISRRHERQKRLCRLEPEMLRLAEHWLGSFREFWESSFERLDTYLETIETEDQEP